MPARTAATAAGVARVGLVLGAVRGGDRGGAPTDRDRAEAAVGLGGQKRRDRRRLGGHRAQAALRAPVGERAPVALVRSAGRRRERRLGVALGARQLVGGDGRCQRRDDGWEVVLSHGLGTSPGKSHHCRPATDALDTGATVNTRVLGSVTPDHRAESEYFRGK